MKNKMRCICIIVTVIVIALILTGCSSNEKTGRCESCGQTEKLYKYVAPSTGDVYWYCQTCYNLAKLFSN